MVLPSFEIVDRQRPVAVVGVPFLAEDHDADAVPGSATAATPHLAPYAAIEVALHPDRPASSATALTLAGADGTRLGVALRGREVSLRVEIGRAHV